MCAVLLLYWTSYIKVSRPSDNAFSESVNLPEWGEISNEEFYILKGMLNKWKGALHKALITFSDYGRKWCVVQKQWFICVLLNCKKQ